MKLIELLVLCVLLIVFVRIFTLVSIQIVDYRTQVVSLLQKTEVVLQKHGDLLYANKKGDANAK